MLSRRLVRFSLLLTVLVFAALAVFAGCGDDDEEDGGGGGGKIDVSGVPEVTDGKLTIGSDIAYAPVEYYEEGTQNATGLDVDLAKALATALGVEVEFKQVADFSGIVGDLKVKRYDIVMSAISITPTREAEIAFVPYFGPVGTGILTPKGNPDNFAKLEDLCGHKVAAQVGTYQVDQVGVLNDGACKADPIDLTTFPDNPASVQELSVGRVEAQLADDPVVAYNAAQSDGKLEVAATGFESATYGIGVRKDSPELKAALEKALKQIRDDGTYDQVLKKWGQEEFALKP
ncbi:MAG: ABC transporter substrate-binding protein [Dehalococcoidia bacterium]|nr:ABC transporter substrate-binding protein [Dehalococcoidia bacterium]